MSSETEASATTDASLSAMNYRKERRNENTDDLLQRELELLRRENAVLQRELRLAERSESDRSTVTPRVSTAPSLRLREVSDLLADFTGKKDNFDAWKGQAEVLRTTYQLSEDAMKVLLSSHLKRKAQEWFHSTSTSLQLSVDELKI